MLLAFRAGLLTDLVLYIAPFMGFPTRRLRFLLQQCIFVNIDGSITVSLLAVKSKVAPLKTISAIEIIRCVTFFSLDTFRVLSANLKCHY